MYLHVFVDHYNTYVLIIHVHMYRQIYTFSVRVAQSVAASIRHLDAAPAVAPKESIAMCWMTNSSRDDLREFFHIGRLDVNHI
jgi:hypothetical protein